MALLKFFNQSIALLLIQLGKLLKFPDYVLSRFKHSKYSTNWEIADAVRELIANAIDEHI